jgi:hypothetical protein
VYLACGINGLTPPTCSLLPTHTHTYTPPTPLQGEELTFDYSCITESEKEFREAICLCGTRRCRGSYLYYAGSDLHMDVMTSKHTFMHRQVRRPGRRAAGHVGMSACVHSAAASCISQQSAASTTGPQDGYLWDCLL